MKPADKAIGRMVSELPGRNASKPTGGLETNKDPEAEPPRSGRRQHGMSRADRSDRPLRRGGGGSTVTRTYRATGEALLVPPRKMAEQGSRITGQTRKAAEDERVAEGFKVAMNWGNSRGAKGPNCFVIPLAMMGGRGV